MNSTITSGVGLSDVFASALKIERDNRNEDDGPLKLFKGSMKEFVEACQAAGIEVAPGDPPTIGRIMVIEQFGRVLIGTQKQFDRLFKPSKASFPCEPMVKPEQERPEFHRSFLAWV